MIRELLAVGGGGALGCMARYLLSYGLLSGHMLFGFPVGTFAVNAVGSLLIGILISVVNSQTAIWLLIVGFCGGFTTFSTFSVDAVQLLRLGQYGTAALYIGLSVGVCIACAALGLWIGMNLKN